jgi:glutathione S-transferase
MLKFYYAPNTCAFASRIALEDAGADYQAIKVDFATNQQNSPDYLKINPKGRVPALATERGVITETTAILAFIAQSYPLANLAPVDDPFAFGQVQAFNGYLASTVHVAHAHNRRGARWADDPAAIAEMKRKVPETMAACFQVIEDSMLIGPWVMGGKYTICDPYLYTIATWLEGDGVDPARFPKVHAHMQVMAERPAVHRARRD